MNARVLVAILAIGLSSCRQQNENSQNDPMMVEQERNATSTSQAASPIDNDSIHSFNDHDFFKNDFDYTYEGQIGNIKVVLNIFQFQGQPKARMFYWSKKKIINMDLVSSTPDKFTLNEKVDGIVTGIWTITASDKNPVTGSWYSPTGDKKLPIQLSLTTKNLDDLLGTRQVKTGKYVLVEVNQDESTKDEYPNAYSEQLHVKDMADDEIYFDLYIQGPPPGMHVGYLNGMASQQGNDYYFANEDGCELSITFTEDSVILRQQENQKSGSNCGFGANISAYGTLKKLPRNHGDSQQP